MCTLQSQTEVGSKESIDLTMDLIPVQLGLQVRISYCFNTQSSHFYTIVLGVHVTVTRLLLEVDVTTRELVCMSVLTTSCSPTDCPASQCNPM